MASEKEIFERLDSYILNRIDVKLHDRVHVHVLLSKIDYLTVISTLRSTRSNMVSMTQWAHHYGHGSIDDQSKGLIKSSIGADKRKHQFRQGQFKKQSSQSSTERDHLWTSGPA